MLEILRDTSVFRGLEAEGIEAITKFCRAITFIAGGDVFTPKRPENRDLYVLYSGHLKSPRRMGKKSTCCSIREDRS